MSQSTTDDLYILVYILAFILANLLYYKGYIQSTFIILQSFNMLFLLKLWIELILYMY